jgi:hypothetical protein
MIVLASCNRDISEWNMSIFVFNLTESSNAPPTTLDGTVMSTRSINCKAISVTMKSPCCYIQLVCVTRCGRGWFWAFLRSNGDAIMRILRWLASSVSQGAAWANSANVQERDADDVVGLERYDQISKPKASRSMITGQCRNLGLNVCNGLT